MSGISVRTPADIGALIRDRRKALGLDQGALAANVGVSRLWINQVEGGKPGANLGLILRTLAALDITLSVATGGPSEAPVTSPDIDAVIAATRRKKNP
ncbi:MAG: helix-turn-helix domain-containing protein [Parvularculaceae bacterium]|nr:helix-turn-helix domain-containing protein [Parvularculaceae bacterium]